MSGQGLKMFAFIPVIYLVNQVDWKNEQHLMYARIGFYAAVGVSVLVYFAIRAMVLNKNDTTRIWVPPKQGLMPDPNARPQETTYHQHELDMANEGLKKTAIMAAMMSFLSFKMGMHMPVGMQAVLLPVDTFTSPLVAKYLFGSKSEAPYGEKLEPPEENEGDAADAGDAAAGAGGAGAGASASNGGAAAASAAPSAETTALLNFVMEKWNSNTAFTYDEVTPLLVDDADINAQTPVQPVEGDADTLVGGMTLLMVAVSFSETTKELVTSLMARGASVMSTDHDSWTVLHWAADSGNATAARALLNVCSGEERRFLLRHAATDGKTALALARDASHPDVAAVIEEVTANFADMDAEDDAAEPPATSAAAPADPAADAAAEADTGAISDVD